MAFLVFEGIDGSGKSTLINKLNTYLQSLGLLTICTREPGGTKLGEKLRELILENEVPPPSPKTELLMYQAIRAQHVDIKIRPALESGKWVLSDRFTASSVAFQSGGRGIDVTEVDWLNRFSTSSLSPKLTFLLDLSYDKAQERLVSRQGEFKDRIENEAKDFHERVRNTFLKLAEQNSEQWVVIDASLSPEQIFDKCLLGLKNKGLLPC